MPACLIETCQKNKILGHWVHPICQINENSPKLQHSFFSLCFQQENHLKGKDGDTYALTGSYNFSGMVCANFPHKGKHLFFPNRSLNHIDFVVIPSPLAHSLYITYSPNVIHASVAIAGPFVYLLEVSIL